jgi:DnaJ-class molecular chaperone
MSQRDYYEVLGIKREASPQIIKEAYRKLAFQYHPDRNRGNPAGLEKMKDINEAYAVLSDPEKRRRYDTFSHEYGPSAYDRFRQTYSDEDIFRGSDIDQVFKEMTRAFGFRNFEEIFRESYGEGHRTFEFRRPGVFGRVIMFGPGLRRSWMSDSQTEGTAVPQIGRGVFGKLLRYFLRKTWGIEEYRKGKDWQEVLLLTPWQALQGGKIKYIHRRKSRELIVTIPPGIRNRQKLRLKGMGEEGKGGAEAGDLYLKIQIQQSFLKKVKALLRK